MQLSVFDIANSRGLGGGPIGDRDRARSHANAHGATCSPGVELRGTYLPGRRSGRAKTSMHAGQTLVVQFT